MAATACGGGTAEPGSQAGGSDTNLGSVADRLGVGGGPASILPRLPSAPTFASSTVPADGDVNPYGVAFVPDGFPRGGLLDAGDIIVANFNNSKNLQGTGTTIVRVNKDASPTVFFSDTAAPGFSTALGVLQGGYVLVGNVPSTDGSGVCARGEDGAMKNVGHGALLVIDRNGKLVKTLTSRKFLDGPWDLTVLDRGSSAAVFVSNVLRGTVSRIDLDVKGEADDTVVVEHETQIASGYVHRCDSGAFVVGPTGVALDPERDVLYIASAGDNKIFAVGAASVRNGDAGRGEVVVDDAKHLHGPLGLVRAANGDLISAQGDAVNPNPHRPSEIVEFTRHGQFVAQFSIDPAPGSAFGLALVEYGNAFRFAAVDDGTNMLDVWER
jgi:hypothetical protein